jgi:hypothetical protein
MRPAKELWELQPISLTVLLRGNMDHLRASLKYTTYMTTLSATFNKNRSHSLLKFSYFCSATTSIPFRDIEHRKEHCREWQPVEISDLLAQKAQKISYVLQANIIPWDSDRFAYAKQNTDGSKIILQHGNVVASHRV